MLTINKHCLQSLLLCFVLHMPNIIQLNLSYIIIDQHKLLTIFRSVLCEIQRNQSNLLTFVKLANQSTLNKAHMIEITKACIVAFMKARNSSVVSCRETGKTQKMVEMHFLKLLLKIFC